MNRFGTRLNTTLLGESHGNGVGAVLDGVPPGIPVDMDTIQARMDERRPGTGPLVSARAEPDVVEVLSGIHAGHTTGAPVLLWIPNRDVRSKDYDAVARLPRPGHSDLTNAAWSRGFHDPRGGGHSSGRLTAPLVAAAALLEPFLDHHGVRVGAHLDQVGALRGDEAPDVSTMRSRVAASPVHTAHEALEERFMARIEEVRKARDSIGGVVAWRAEGVPIAWGDPFWDGAESLFAHAFFAIPAVKGVDFGAGFDAVSMLGSQHNDPIIPTPEGGRPATDHAGGILGGRTTGTPLTGRVAIKPTSSIFQPQDTVDLETGKAAILELTGRHDPCIAVRAVPVVRAVAELVLADLALLATAQGHATPWEAP